jgi:thiamine biosynthesis protein ThiS
MQLSINGKVREFAELDENPTLARLLEILEMKADRVAVERNGNIVTRSDWPAEKLSDGDKLEIVQFVGGGMGDENRPLTPPQGSFRSLR